MLELYIYMGIIATVANFIIMRQAEGSSFFTWKDHAFQASLMFFLWPLMSAIFIYEANRGDKSFFAA